MILYFSIYFETTFITCTLPNSKSIYTQYQNNIKVQGQRQISRSSDWIRLSNPFCFGQEITEYLMLFILMYYCYLTIYQSWSLSLQVKKKLQSKEGGIKSCVNTLFQFFSMVILLQWNFGCRLCIQHVEWMRWPGEARLLLGWGPLLHSQRPSSDDKCQTTPCHAITPRNTLSFVYTQNI